MKTCLFQSKWGFALYLLGALQLLASYVRIFPHHLTMLLNPLCFRALLFIRSNIITTISSERLEQF